MTSLKESNMKTHNYGSHLALVAVTCSLVACTKSVPVSTAAAMNGLVAGTYRVCNVASGVSAHGDLFGEHVREGETLVIQKIDPTSATLVCLDGPCPADPMDPQVEDKVLWMTGNATKLETVQPLTHEDRENGGNVHTRHLIQLTVATGTRPPKCTKPQLFSLRFCVWDLPPAGSAKEWLCQSDTPHGGVAHVEPPSP
jgi:hypothetical protein